MFTILGAVAELEGTECNGKDGPLHRVSGIYQSGWPDRTVERNDRISTRRELSPLWRVKHTHVAERRSLHY